jgi:hypothetical protein
MGLPNAGRLRPKSARSYSLLGEMANPADGHTQGCLCPQRSRAVSFIGQRNELCRTQSLNTLLQPFAFHTCIRKLKWLFRFRTFFYDFSKADITSSFTVTLRLSASALA